jgi:hypothetical protein
MTNILDQVLSDVMCARLFVLRQDMKLAKWWMKSLCVQNLLSSKPAVSEGGPVVSLTTYGRRLHTVYLTLESIAAGRVLPSRLILWLDEQKALNNLPSTLRRLEDRGLEIMPCENFGPHKKYYPYVRSVDSVSTPLVTADDDVLYSRWWLAGLVQGYLRLPEVINCYRAHVMSLSSQGISPYLSWKECRTNSPSHRHFATGVSGCIYPPRFLEVLKLRGTQFLECCPKADDVWLHASALRSGFRVRQIYTEQLNFPVIPGTQSSGLSIVNCGLALNDEQIRATYAADDLALLRSQVGGGGNAHGKKYIIDADRVPKRSRPTHTHVV